MEKQPAERSSPLLNVEVAPEVKRMFPPEIVNPPAVSSVLEASIPPPKVEVPRPNSLVRELSPISTVLVAMRAPEVVVPEIRAFPCTEKVWAGDVVPIPTLPDEVTMN